MIARIGHIELATIDLERAVAYAVDVMGLREVERVNGRSYLTCNERHHELIVAESTITGLGHIGLEVESEEQLELAYAALMREGVEIFSQQPEEAGIAHALRFLGPGGFVFELFTGMKTNQAANYRTMGARPRKFGHVTLNIEDVQEMEHFLIRVLGFRVSDRVGTLATWLHCNHDHHGIALAKGPNRLHHYAWEVQDLAAIGRTADLLAAYAQTPAFVWGPGRHGPGNNLFSYFKDAVGAMVEYYADLAQIDNEGGYQARDWPEHALNLWGEGPPPAFLDQG